MDNYIPFLKLKSNEILAVKELESKLQGKITPFFDFPTKDTFTENDFIKKVKTMVNSVRKYLGFIPYFYLDNFDVDSNLFVDGVYNYTHLIESFSGLRFVPVISIDRCDDHMEAVCKAKRSGDIDSDTVAIRLVPEDFESYDAVEDELHDEMEEVFDLFDNIDIIFDCRVCLKSDLEKIVADIVNFSKGFYEDFTFRKLIVTGSSIPASISEITSTESEVELPRSELKIFNSVHTELGEEFELILGDYGVVSPNYSEVKIIPEAMLNITAAKIIYTFDDQHFIMRGGSLKSHPRGFEQYNDLAGILVRKYFYRGANFSFGDNYIEQKSNGIGKNVMPGTIIKPAQNAHIAFMMKNYEIESTC